MGKKVRRALFGVAEQIVDELDSVNTAIAHYSGDHPAVAMWQQYRDGLLFVARVLKAELEKETK